MSTRALRTAASGLYAQQLNVEVISNNIANVNTTGFKKNKAEFQDLMYQEVQVNPTQASDAYAAATPSAKIQVGNGVQSSSTQKIFKQGDIVATNNQMDIAIQGDGLFQVRKSDGTIVYTRDGSFKINSEGKMVTSGGYLLDPEITLPNNVQSISISRDGSVDVLENDGRTSTLGTVELAKFMNPSGLLALGNNLYGETASSGAPMLGTAGSKGFGEINQGFLESSNVDIVEEMVAMITAQRAYEINSKTVKTVEDMMTMANNLKT